MTETANHQIRQQHASFIVADVLGIYSQSCTAAGAQFVGAKRGSDVVISVDGEWATI